MELRDRLLRMVLAILVIFIALFPFANEIYRYIADPLMAVLPEGTSMIATQVASPFLTPFKLSLVAAVFVAMPYILHQFWAFVAPGLYQHERRLAMPLLASSIVLFYAGMAFAYYVVFPLVFGFLTGVAPDGVAVMTDITAYLDFVLTLFFAFGLAFEVPIATIILVWAGITTPQALAGKRPYIIVGAFVIGMLLTPPDVISQTLLALPMWLLFELGVVFSRLFVKKVEPEDEEDQAMEAAGGGAAAAATPGDQSPVGELDEPRFVPMTPEEMEAELDAIEAEETAPAAPSAPAADERRAKVDAKLERVQQLREAMDFDGMRRLLYEILVEGDEDQITVARNILAQLDEPQ
jgi:sec-independent protein translocase protein TatC